MIKHLNELMDMHAKFEEEYDKEERNLISVGFKNWIGVL